MKKAWMEERLSLFFFALAFSNNLKAEAGSSHSSQPNIAEKQRTA